MEVLLVQAMLSPQLVYLGILWVRVLHRAQYIFADIQRTVGGITIPPPYQLLVVGSLVPYLPIELRHAIVHPAIVHPFEYVGVKVVIILQAICRTAIGV